VADHRRATKEPRFPVDQSPPEGTQRRAVEVMNPHRFASVSSGSSAGALSPDERDTRERAERGERRLLRAARDAARAPTRRRHRRPRHADSIRCVANEPRRAVLRRGAERAAGAELGLACVGVAIKTRILGRARGACRNAGRGTDAVTRIGAFRGRALRSGSRGRARPCPVARAGARERCTAGCGGSSTRAPDRHAPQVSSTMNRLSSTPYFSPSTRSPKTRAEGSAAPQNETIVRA
jgi:hypothetical protein